MNIDLNEDEIKLLVGLVENAYVEANEVLDPYDEPEDRYPHGMGSHPAQILSNELTRLRKMSTKLAPPTFGTQKKRTVTEVA